MEVFFMKKEIFSYLKKGFIPGIFLSSIVMLSILPVSCKGPVEGLIVLEGDYESPKILSLKVKSADSLEINFSKSVEISNLSVVCGDIDQEGMSEEGQIQKVGISCEMKDGFEKENSFYGSKLKVTTNENMITGETYEIDGTCTDENGNSLTFSIPFLGYNSRIPNVVISEVRNAYGWSTAGGEKRRRGEYVELYVLSDGNLSGIKIMSANDGEKTAFVLPSCEVKAGEYITVHMRRFNDGDLNLNEKIVSELKNDLNLSSTKDSSSSRDIWNDNFNSCFSTSDIIVLQRVFDDYILDCVEYKLSEVKDWPSSYNEVLNAVKESKAWEGEPLCTDNLSATSLTRGIARQNIADLSKFGVKKEASSKEDFLVVKKITPGFENSDVSVTEK